MAPIIKYLIDRWAEDSSKRASVWFAGGVFSLIAMWLSTQWTAEQASAVASIVMSVAGVVGYLLPDSPKKEGKE